MNRNKSVSKERNMREVLRTYEIQVYLLRLIIKLTSNILNKVDINDALKIMISLRLIQKKKHKNNWK